MRTPPLNLLFLAGLPLALLAPTLSGCGINDGPPARNNASGNANRRKQSRCPGQRRYLAADGGGVVRVPAYRANVNRTPQSGRSFEFSLSLTRQAPEGSEKHYSKPDSNIRFFLPSVLAPGYVCLKRNSVTRSLPVCAGPPRGVDRLHHQSRLYHYPTGPGPASGQLVITRFDTVARVVAGTFEFTGQRGAELIKVTQGRFDVTY